ncbi:hypothetical protein DPMN_032240 [Dreissena polymorpha]|uniref:C2H2-type domain-containing protein n=1 Tax=Dreissena polymorpha TaxID=45954 RepID=A0A9D4M4L8_DREPO|nr:hypothetical protein DPMN_032240 [Dreissena polymorpha]
MASHLSADGETLECPDCGEKFRFMYSLMAHIRFRCTCSRGSYSISPHSKTKTPVRISRASHLNQEGVERKVTENVNTNRSVKRKLDSEESFDTDNNEHSIKVTSFEISKKTIIFPINENHRFQKFEVFQWISIVHSGKLKSSRFLEPHL